MGWASRANRNSTENYNKEHQGEKRPAKPVREVPAPKRRAPKQRGRPTSAALLPVMAALSVTPPESRRRR